MSDYPAFGKIPRLNREYTVTEKIDGTNGLVSVELSMGWKRLDPVTYEKHNVFVDGGSVYVEGEDGETYRIRAGSRTRWITPDKDNFGFAAWVYDNARELTKLGEGLHYGEWYGRGIQRGYGLIDRRFMLFNTDRWSDPETRPECCEVATTLFRGTHDLTGAIDSALNDLMCDGSKHVPGFDRPEGVVVYHSASRGYFKVLLEGDDIPKGLAA